jgi:hypothetical protein
MAGAVIHPIAAKENPRGDPGFHHVPDAVQRLFSDAPQSRDLPRRPRWAPDQQRITPHARRAAQHPGHVGRQPPTSPLTTSPNSSHRSPLKRTN